MTTIKSPPASTETQMTYPKQAPIQQAAIEMVRFVRDDLPAIYESEDCKAPLRYEIKLVQNANSVSNITAIEKNGSWALSLTLENNGATQKFESPMTFLVETYIRFHEYIIPSLKRQLKSIGTQVLELNGQQLSQWTNYVPGKMEGRNFIPVSLGQIATTTTLAAEIICSNSITCIDYDQLKRMRGDGSKLEKMSEVIAVLEKKWLLANWKPIKPGKNAGDDPIETSLHQFLNNALFGTYISKKTRIRPKALKDGILVCTVFPEVTIRRVARGDCSNCNEATPVTVTNKCLKCGAAMAIKEAENFNLFASEPLHSRFIYKCSGCNKRYFNSSLDPIETEPGIVEFDCPNCMRSCNFTDGITVYFNDPAVTYDWKLLVQGSKDNLGEQTEVFFDDDCSPKRPDSKTAPLHPPQPLDDQCPALEQEEVFTVAQECLSVIQNKEKEIRDELSSVMAQFPSRLAKKNGDKLRTGNEDRAGGKTHSKYSHLELAQKVNDLHIELRKVWYLKATIVSGFTSAEKNKSEKQAASLKATNAKRALTDSQCLQAEASLVQLIQNNKGGK